jgi:hypothetical protein
LKLRFVTLRLTPEEAPVPLKLTICGPSAASSAIVIVPVLSPGALGLKPTVIAQLPPGATDPVQLLVWVKSPDDVTDEMARVAVPLLVSVRVCGALVVPTFSLPKLKLMVLSVTAGAPLRKRTSR